MSDLPEHTKESIKNILKQDKRLVSKDDKLLKNKTAELARKLDENLISLLLKNDQTNTRFFKDVDEAVAFDVNSFISFIYHKDFLEDSYTKYKNKIGLTFGDNGPLISKGKDAVLSWPYKDCVLEGGQTKEDAKRDEIFWNEILAGGEITRLKEPKVLSNWKRVDKSGEQKATTLDKKDDGTLDENLVLKGNNLLALHSLKERYAGKVKLIYIDPPFNTHGAANTFAYNNRFNHSSWLTFMKNRLEVAKHLLKEDGILAVAIDHFELFYLGVLADEVFKRENRLGVAAVVHNPGGRQDDKFFPTAHENMLFYAKNIDQVKLNTLGISEKKLKEFKYKDENGRYKLRGFRRSGSNSKKEERPGLYYKIFYNSDNNELYLNKKNEDDHLILPIDSNGIERCWRWGPKTLMKKKDKYIEVKKKDEGYDIYIKERESDYEGEKPKTIWDKSKYSGQTGTYELKSIFNEKRFSY